MKSTAAFLAAVTFCAASLAYADYVVSKEGMWPKTWPAELEPLRKQSRTLEGPQVLRLHHEIPFTKREEFEAAWPHLLKVKSKGAPVILVRAPDKRLGTVINAGVRVYAPPRQKDDRAMPETPLPGERPARQRWIYTTFIELVVDGEVVDLNRIPLPADTPIIDERFEDGDREASNRGGGRGGK